MDDERQIRFIDTDLGEKPCAKSAGRWRELTPSLAVCDECDDPPVTCYRQLNPEKR